ncbi:MAG: DUF4434 domain-containing protein [Proteobacteria bacterium]|nr:DUF4434 domain-containing protein [Pseudomonadota bacterium]
MKPTGLRRREFTASLLLPWFAAAAPAGAQPQCAVPSQRGIIWQPWARHGELDKAGWRALGRELVAQNYTHVLLQWSSYGNYEFWPRQQQAGWLASGLEAWRGSGLKLVVGLHMAEDYYSALQQSDASLRAHLLATGQRSLAQARQIVQHPPPLEVQGWYLPQEIDDLNWRTPARRRMLRTFLAAMTDGIVSMAPGMDEAPVYASAFFSGASTPQEFAGLLLTMYRATGVIWLVQDGLGTGRMSEELTAAYLREIARTLPPAAWRGLLETFDQVQALGQPPRFEPSDEATIARRAALWCSSTGRQASVTFSLNQRMKAMLPEPTAEPRQGATERRPQNRR